MGGGNGKRSLLVDLAEMPVDEFPEVQAALAHEGEVRKEFDRAEKALLHCQQALRVDVVTTSMVPEPTAAERTAAKRDIAACTSTYEEADQALRAARADLNRARERAAKTLSEARLPALITLIQKACACADILAEAAERVQAYQLRTVALGGSSREFPTLLSRFINVHGTSSWGEERKWFEQKGLI